MASQPGNFPQRYVVIDVETTGKYLDDQVVEVAALRIVDGQVAGEFQSFVRATKPISPGASAVSGITDDDIADAPDPAEVIPAYFAFVGPDCLVGHNVGFDLRALRSAAEDVGCCLPEGAPIYDTLALAQYTVRGPDNYKLATLCCFFDLPAGEYHRALADCYHTYQLLECLRAQGLADADLCYTTWPKRAPRKRAYKPFDAKAYAPDAPVAPNGSPLYNKRICITGSPSQGKDATYTAAARVGAIPQQNVTNKTDYLLVGVQDDPRVGADGISDKMEDAAAKNASGKAHIEVIDEETFWRLIDMASQPYPPDEALRQIKAILLDAMRAQQVDGKFLLFAERQSFVGAYLVNEANLVTRISLGGAQPHIDVPHASLVAEGVEKQDDDNYYTMSLPGCRITEEESRALKNALAYAIRQVPSQMDCCGSYVLCSDMRACQHQDDADYIGCTYKRNLLAGRIFYGVNDNRAELSGRNDGRITHDMSILQKRKP